MRKMFLVKKDIIGFLGHRDFSVKQLLAEVWPKFLPSMLQRLKMPRLSCFPHKINAYNKPDG